MIDAQKSECPAATGQDAKQSTNDLDFATGQRPGKALATLIAQLAMHGHAVHTMQGGDFLVCKYGLSYYAADFEALQAFARKLGVTQ